MSIETLQGDPIAPGFAVGPLYVSKGEGRTAPSVSTIDDPSLEIDRFRQQLHVLERGPRKQSIDLNRRPFAPRRRLCVPT